MSNRWSPSARDAALAFALALVVRLLFRLEIAGDPLFSVLVIDARSYDRLARGIAAGDFGAAPLWYAPLYPTLIGLFYRVFGPIPSAIPWMQHGLGAGTAALGVLLGARFSRTAGRVAGGMLALSPVLMHYEGQLLYASGAVFLTALFLLLWLRAMDRGGARTAVASGLAFSALLLLRTNAVLFLPVAAVLLFRRRGPRPTLLFGGASVLLLLPVLLYNGMAGGSWTPFTVNSGMIFATGFSEDSLGGRAMSRTPDDFGPDGAFQREAERRTGRSMTLAEASDFHRAEAMRRIRERPAWALGLTLRKLRLLASAREIDDNLGLPAASDRALLLRLWPASWAFFLVAGAAGATMLLRRPASRARTDGVALGLWILVYGGSLLLFFVNARYRLPLLVPLAVLSGVAVGEAVDLARAGRWRELALPGLVAAIVAVPAFADPGVRADPSQVWSAVGASFLHDGRPAEALAILDRAVAADASNAAARHHRAMALAALGRPDEALVAAREATARDPELPDAWLLQGTLLARAGRLQEALPAFERAVSLAPRDAGALRNVAQALAGLERWSEAADVGRRAVEAGEADLAPRVETWERAAQSGPPDDVRGAERLVGPRGIEPRFED